LRRRNFVALEISRHLVRAGPGWRPVVPEPEVKTGRPPELPFPEVLVPVLERYLAIHRSVLVAQAAPGGVGSQALWLSARGRRLHEATLGFHIKALTRAAFGRSVNLYLFRDCTVTSLAIEGPAHVGIAAQVLGHGTLATERHYNLARGQEAAARWHETLDRLRRREKRKEST
jgi:hypothetical protein